MDKIFRRDIVYVIIVIIFMLSILCLMTFIHESGHVVAATLLGGKVEEFNFTWFNGGTVKWSYMIEDPEHWITIRTVVRLSGGLAVSLFFVFLGFFKRPFLLIVPLHIIDGIIEVFGTSDLHTSLVQLTALIMAIAVNHALYVKLRESDET